MGWKFNPFTASLDHTGSGGGGGGASYIDGEVATYNDLRLDGTAPLNSAWLVSSSSGIWPFNKPGGIYIRTATAGSSRDADYTYAGTLPDVFSDSVFTLYDETDSTKNLQFQLSGITTGTTRTLTAPDANGTIALESEVRSDFVSPYTYIGLANAGTSESTALWLIRRSEFDAGGTYISTLTANNVQWANRLTASYS